jgi:hypothetical protein
MSQAPKNKRTPEEILRAIEESDADDEAERILALSEEDLDRELADAGFDPETVRAKGKEIGERLTRGSGAPKPAEATGATDTASDGSRVGAPVVKFPEPKRATVRARWVVLLAAALTAIAVGIIPFLDGVATPRPTSVEEKKAAALRKKAHDECAATNWRACLDDVNAAKTLDPTGENESVRRDRDMAETGLRGAP